MKKRALLKAAGFGATLQILSSALPAGTLGQGRAPRVWDVIVIGSGMAGLSAAVSAAQAGARHVLVLEKGPMIGGHTLYSSGSIAVISPKRQQPLGIEDSVERLINDCMAVGGEGVSKKHIEVLGEHSQEALDWLESCGVMFRGGVFQALGGLHPRAVSANAVSAGRRYISALNRMALTYGVSIEMNVKAQKLYHRGELLKEALSVEAVRGGEKRVFHAKELVIATGGFTANIAMRMMADARLDSAFTTTANPEGLYWDGATGDGIVMGEALGAGLADMKSIQLLPFWGGRLLDYVGGDIYISREGYRIVNEGASWREITEAILAEPTRSIWVITDSKSVKGTSLGFKLTNATIKKSNSVKDMAKEMSIDVSVLNETLRRYNDAAKSGVDKAFGKREFTQTIDTPPYYWGLEHIYVHTTLGGLTTNPQGQLTDRNGVALDGFWAAGETVGGIFGIDRVGGLSLLNCLVMGRLCGQGAGFKAKDREANF